MGRPAGWMKELTGRSPVRSPGAPSLRREVQQEFWRVIATGVTSEEAAATVGVSQAVGSRWFRHGGGMPPMDLTPLKGRYLSFHELRSVCGVEAAGWDWGSPVSSLPHALSREEERGDGGPHDPGVVSSATAFAAFVDSEWSFHCFSAVDEQHVEERGV